MQADAFVVSFSIGLILGLIWGMIIVGSKWKFEAVSKGYAQYCSIDGHFAWKGECDK